MIKLWFIFSLIWSVCASVDEDGRKKMDKFLREREGTFPNKVIFLTYHQYTHPMIYRVTMKCFTQYIIDTLIRTPSMSTTLTLRTKPGHHLRTSCPKAGVITPSKWLYDLVPLCVSKPMRYCHLHTPSVATCPGL